MLNVFENSDETVSFKILALVLMLSADKFISHVTTSKLYLFRNFARFAITKYSCQVIRYFEFNRMDLCHDNWN